MEDKELVNVFIEEALELIGKIQESLVLMDQPNQCMEAVRAIKRDLHTIKGGAKMVKQIAIADVIHALESVIENQITQAPDKIIACKSEIIDKIGIASNMVHAIRQKKPDSTVQQITTDLRALAGDIHIGLSQLEATYELWRKDQKSGELMKALQAGYEKVKLLSHKINVDTIDMLVKRIGVVIEEWADPTKPNSEISFANWDELQANLSECLTALVSGKPMPNLDSETGLRGAQAGLLNRTIKVNANLLGGFNSLATSVSIAHAHAESDLLRLIRNAGDLLVGMDELKANLSLVERKTARLIRFFPESYEVRAAEREISDIMNKIGDSHINMTQALVNIRVTMMTTENILVEQGKAAADLQVGLTNAQMFSFEEVIPRLERLVEQVSSQLGKKVTFVHENLHQEIDRQLLDGLIFPLEHMVRNAIDHGIESPEQRVAANKPEAGVIRLSIERSGSNLLVSLKDDGQGINVSKLREKAIARGLLHKEVQLSNQELLRFIFQPG
ncbi:MAG: Hpt domain-containing protein, partial [Pseudomonadota bacterium]